MGLELERRPNLPFPLRLGGLLEMSALLFVIERTQRTKKPPLFGRGLIRSVDLNVGEIPDQPIAGA